MPLRSARRTVKPAAARRPARRVMAPPSSGVTEGQRTRAAVSSTGSVIVSVRSTTAVSNTTKRVDTAGSDASTAPNTLE